MFWGTQDDGIQDIERIEVTRVPGGSVWNANAVNGVINVITKKAADTRGTLVDRRTRRLAKAVTPDVQANA